MINNQKIFNGIKISTMKSIDGSLGKVICIFLNIFENIKILFKKSEPISNPKNILISKYFGIGSILNSLPIYNLIKKHYPKAKIIYLTFSNPLIFFHKINAFFQK